MKKRSAHWPILTALTLVACGGEPADRAATAPATAAETAAAAAHGDEVAWFDGDVEAAFASARSEGKPLFLYWGAKWCPPCHYLKDKIFRRPEFVAKSRRFVSVYLDGDSERAQLLLEEYGMQGYPTVIVFSSAGEELIRMPSDIPVERYAGVLDAALAGLRPVAEVLAAALAEEAPPEAADLHLLAFHSWSQDSRLDLDEAGKLTTFRALYERTPDELAVEKSRFLTLWLGAAADADDASAPALGEDERGASDAAVRALLADPELRRANLSFVFYASRDTVELLHPSPTPERQRLIAAWDAAAAACEDDETLSTDDRLSALLPRLWLARLAAGGEGAGEPPAELVERVRQRIAWADAEVTGESELQAVMSTMAGLLEEAGLSAEAEALLTERMGETTAPYYYMSWVAGMKRRAGEPEQALEWYHKAYTSAEGRYTRFRWGSVYLRQLMSLAAEDTAALEQRSREILGELLTFDDAFAGGNHMRLGQLDQAYGEWSAAGEREAVIGRLRELVHDACGRFEDDGEDSQRRRCLGFLTPEGAA